MTHPMPARSALVALLAALAVGSGCRDDRAPSPAPDPDVLVQASAFLDADRPWSAARLLRSAEASDARSPGARLLAARAEAGTGQWDRVRMLLDGVPGLDSLDGGRGLYLLARAQDVGGHLDAARDGYDAFLGMSDTSTSRPPKMNLERAAARLRRALVIVQQDPEAGERALANATDVPADWRAVLQVEALARAGDTERVEALARRMAGLGRVSRGEGGRRVWAARIDAARRSGDLDAARDLVQQAQARAGSDAARASFSLTAAQLAAEAGDDDAARAGLRAAIAADAGSAAARRAAGTLRDRARRDGTLDADDWLALGRTDRALGLNGEAADAFQRWLAAGVGTPAAQVAVRLEAADALFDAQRYGEVEAMLAPIRDRSEARELQAGALGRMGRTDEAAALYLDLAASDPAPNLYFAADVLQQGGDLAAAGPLYERIEREHPTTTWAALATLRRAGQAFLDADYAQAARLWDGLAARQPGGRDALRARYWAGRAWEGSGNPAAASDRYRRVLQDARDSYYALLASEALGEPFWPLPMRASPPVDADAAARVETALHGADVLREAGFPDAAGDELDAAIARVGRGAAVRYALAEALVVRGYGQRAIRIGQTLPGGTTTRRMRILYPFPFRRMIAAEAEAQGLDPFLAAALIRQESQFSERATSHVGARGLMQLMPATARALAEEIGLRDWDPEQLYVPEVNVHLGMRYVGQQAAAYDGALPAIFGAYNAGPHQVDAWRSFPEYGRDALFTERIPFRETRDYVKILTRNRAIYRGLYGRPGA